MIFLKLGNLNFDDEEEDEEDDAGGADGTPDCCCCCCSRLYLPFLGLTWEFIAFSILLIPFLFSIILPKFSVYP